MINVQETTSVFPVCPHCNEEVKNVFARELLTTFGKRYMYFCSLCKKVLGVSQRKGFWMG